MHKTALLAGAAVLTLIVHQARAGSLYAFGDSLSDNGNLYKLIHYPPPPYAGGRFSNGPVWVEYLPSLTGLSFKAANDYAYGGAYTGDITFNGVDYGTNIVAPSLPGITTEIAQFTATGQRFGKSDIVTLWGGANNYFRYADLIAANLPNAKTIISEGVASTISELDGDATALIRLGARTLLVPNIPDFGVTPDYNGNPLTIALGTDISTAHNAALPPIAALLHRQTGANIIVLNEYQLLNSVVADPARYGLVNVTDACIDSPACVGSAATQNTYLFWDGVHPTTHAHQFIAEYAADSLLEFESLSVPAQLGLSGAQDFSALLDTRMQALRGGAGGFSYNIDGATGTNGDPGQQFGLFIAGGGGEGYRNNDSGTNLGFTYANAATLIGADYRFNPNLTAGVALGYGDDHADVNAGGKVRNNAFNAGLYALAASGPVYIKTSVGYGDDWYRTSRPGVFSGITGKPHGATYMAAIEGGYNLAPWYGIGLTPQLGMSYDDAALQGYTENGDPLLTEQISSQGYQQILATAGFAASTGLNIGNIFLVPYASAASQIHIAGEGDSFSSSFTDEPLVSQTDSYPKQPKAWALFGAGASAALSNSLTASVNVKATALKSNGNDFYLTGAASWRF
jgi:outer membrane lipase/esterase